MADVIRVVKNGNYTTMGNFHFREKGLSYKAMGLLSFMLSLPDDWDYTISGLARCAKDGVDSVRSALLELEEFGFLERPGMARDDKGHYQGSEYVIHEEPLLHISKKENPCNEELFEPYCSPPQVQPILENPTLDEPVEVAESLENTEKDDTPPNMENPTLENPTLENPILENPTLEKAVSGNPILENPTWGNPIQGKPPQINTNILNTNILNTNIPNQCACEAAQETDENPEDYIDPHKKGMYFPESKELSDAFYDWIYMRKRKGGGALTPRVVMLTKQFIRDSAPSGNGGLDINTALDIVNFSVRNQYSKLYSLEERKKTFGGKYNKAQSAQDLEMKSPTYDKMSDDELESLIGVANA